MVKEIDIQVHEAQRVPNKMDAKRPLPPRHIVIKMAKVKDKERLLKAAKGHSYLQRSSHRLSVDFSKET